MKNKALERRLIAWAEEQVKTKPPTDVERELADRTPLGNGGGRFGVGSRRTGGKAQR